MDFSAEYQQKRTTAREAVKVVKSGDWVELGWCCAQSRELDEALAARYAELTDVKVRGGVALRQPEITKVPDTAEHFTWYSWHTGGLERRLLEQGKAFYVPLRYSEMPRYYLDSAEGMDVAMFQVAPMDRDGYFNFGPNASHMAELCAVAKVIVVEVNQNLPYCLGAGHNGIHISKVDMIVEGSNPPVPQLPAGAPTEVDQQVARLVLEEIPDGACIQLGIGGMPNAVGALIAQSDLKDLGVHTEMLVDSFVDMAAAGKLTGERKRLDRGRHVYTFGAGTQKLYDFLHNNPFAYNAPVNYVNDVRVIAQLDDFMSINNCINVDLFGQVSSETSGLKHISGAGGQQDFLLGAYLSNGGKSFICCSSTAQEKGGASVSRILPTLPEGSVVTATRTNIQYLVTEYGKVNLKGKSTWQRAEAIISVAHPDHREELIAAAERMGIWRGSNRK